MPRLKNTDGGIEDLGVLLTAAYGLDVAWKQKAACSGWGSNRPGHPTPWQVAPGRKYNGISGSELVKYALLICSSCSAQYDCAIYAVKALMCAGSWSMSITQLRALQARDDAIDVIENAREMGVPVQVVTARAFALVD